MLPSGSVNYEGALYDEYYRRIGIDHAMALPARLAAILTPRERQVVDSLSSGKTDRDIAAILGCGHRTVQEHLQRIYDKLGVETRTAPPSAGSAARRTEGTGRRADVTIGACPTS